MKKEFPWMNRHINEHAFKKYCDGIKKTEKENDPAKHHPFSMIGGRPVGLIISRKRDIEVALKYCKNKIAITYKEYFGTCGC